MDNKSFCVLPFIHLHVNEHNDVKLCCMADRYPIKKFSPEFDFNNDIQMQEIRTKLLSGEQIEHCRTCYEYEERGANSWRISANKMWKERLNLESYDNMTPNLVYYDIRNDNLCNLSCRMCGPQSSSQLEKEFTKIGWPVQSSPKSFGFSDVIDFDTVQLIYVSGGEPTLLPKFKLFLKDAISKGKTNFGIQMNTNGTNLNQELLELLSHFNVEFIIVSLDGYNKINKYIRWPADWNSIVTNAHKLAKVTKELIFNLTASIWNISNLSSTVLFIESEFPDALIITNAVKYPEFNVFTTFPDKELALNDLQQIVNYSKLYKNEPNFRSKIDYYISALKDSEINLEALRQFFEYNDTLDKSRNIKLKDYIPELENCRSYLK
mgnify:CR=1 FL=1